MSVLTQLTVPGEARPLKIAPEAIYSSSFHSFVINIVTVFLSLIISAQKVVVVFLEVVDPYSLIRYGITIPKGIVIFLLTRKGNFSFDSLSFPLILFISLAFL